MPALFIPGWGAHPSLYRGALPSGWEVLEPPTFRASRGSFEAYPAWLRFELESRTGPFVLGGHSFGAALAVVAASRDQHPIERLVLVDPAGLPLSKPIRACLADFGSQLATGLYPLRPAARSIASALAAPRAALRLAGSVRSLDLSSELDALRRCGVPCSVITADTDSLTPPEHCRKVARLAGGDYRELRVAGGHVGSSPLPASFGASSRWPDSSARRPLETRKHGPAQAMLVYFSALHPGRLGTGGKPACVHGGERERGQAMGVDREADRDDGRRDEQAHVWERGAFEQDDGEDDRGEAARPEPADEGDRRPVRAGREVRGSPGIILATVRLRTA